MASTAKKKSFWDAIGRPKLVVAPMVGQSELPYRLLTRRYGADLCYTPMYHSRLMLDSEKYRQKVLNDLGSAKDRPLLFQLCGYDPEILLKASRLVEHLCDGIDLNLGCPQGIARRGKYGAFLLERKELVLHIVRTLSSNLKVPLTCKIRIYPDIDATLKMAKDIEEAGCQMLCVHGRTKEQKKQLICETDWATIRRIKENASIPIIANGSIGVFDDIERCLLATRADGVMSAEAILENPGFFHSPLLADEAPFARQLRLTEEYLAICEEHMPSPPSQGIKIVSKHVMQFMFGGFMANKPIIPRLFKSKTLEDVKEVVRAVREATVDGTLQTMPALAYSVHRQGRWYSRHVEKKARAAAKKKKLLQQKANESESKANDSKSKQNESESKQNESESKTNDSESKQIESESRKRKALNNSAGGNGANTGVNGGGSDVSGADGGGGAGSGGGGADGNDGNGAGNGAVEASTTPFKKTRL